MGMLMIPLLVRLISVPSKLISPVVVTLCFIGAFAASNEVEQPLRDAGGRPGRLLHEQV